ncbi:stressosome-associated protein Prli42 [Siminovitchia sediminis]
MTHLWTGQQCRYDPLFSYSNLHFLTLLRHEKDRCPDLSPQYIGYKIEGKVMRQGVKTLSNKKLRRFIIYLMVFSMIATTLMAGLSFML